MECGRDRAVHGQHFDRSLIDQFIPSLALGFVAVKFYRRFLGNRSDSYNLHALYWLGLLPSRTQTIPAAYIRGFLP